MQLILVSCYAHNLLIFTNTQLHSDVNILILFGHLINLHTISSGIYLMSQLENRIQTATI